MKKALIVALTTALILVSFSVYSSLETDTVSASTPSYGVLQVQARDFAVDRFSDPWNMNNSSDIARQGSFRHVSMSKSVWRGTTNSRHANLWTLWGGYPGSFSTGKDGAANSINANFYKRVSFRMYLGVSSTAYRRGILYWFKSRNLRRKGHLLFKLYPGWHTYQIDMPWNWNGAVTGLRINPIDKANVPVKLDWVRVTNRPGARITVTWNDTTSGKAMVYADNNASGYDGTSVRTLNSNIGANAASIDLDGFSFGNYYFYVKNAAGNYSGYQSFTVMNMAPVIKIEDPDAVGGRDWAIAAIKNRWDMRSGRDLGPAYNIAGTRFRRGIYTGVNAQRSKRGKRKNDPYVLLNLRGKTINTRKFHRLTFRYKYARRFSLKYGTMTRIGWTTKRYNDPKHWQMTDDIITYSGWNTITIDLKKIKLNRGHYGWRNWVTRLRFDPHEDRRSRRFYLDYVTLREDDKVGRRGFVIRYKLNDNNNEYVNLSIYRDRDRRPGNGNEALITTLRVKDGRRGYRWRPSRRIKGTYWINIRANDGVNITSAYSSGPLRVRT